MNTDLDELYRFEVDEYNASKPPLYSVPEDKLLANIFINLKEGVVDCFQHDSLLAHVEEENLSEEVDISIRSIFTQHYFRNAKKHGPSLKDIII
jgi:hypothetical protein